MSLMAWNSCFETGIERIDEQHRVLIDMVNAAAAHLALDDDVAKRSVNPLLDQLFRYAGTHFSDEERLMTQYELLPTYQVHHHQGHVAFVQELTQMRQQYEREASLSGKDLLRFLSSWLGFHILVEDQRMAKQVAAVKLGQTAQQAYDQAHLTQDAAHAVYNTSLLDLFTLLTERNQALGKINEEIQRTKAALETANATLEQRVQQRTQELEAMVARLSQTQHQLLQSEKLAVVGQLAAGVAHEINNPVGFVNSNLGSLTQYLEKLFDLLAAYEQSATSLSAPEQSQINEMRRRVEIDYLREDIPMLLKESKDGLTRVKRIVSDLRDFSHADDGQRAPADLNQLLDAALNMVANELKFRAEVVKQLTALPEVLCIGPQITQVLVNLLVNAAQAIDTKGTVTLRSGVQDDSVWLEISDTGCGMSPEVQERIFEPFYSTKPVGKGTGLGLSISWEIIQRHGGKITLTSAVGQGSSFRLALPAGRPG